MNITDIKPFVMWAEGSGRNWMFVKVETDEGIHGWGEGGLVNQATTIAEAVHMLAHRSSAGARSTSSAPGSSCTSTTGTGTA